LLFIMVELVQSGRLLIFSIVQAVIFFFLVYLNLLSHIRRYLLLLQQYLGEDYRCQNLFIFIDLLFFDYLLIIIIQSRKINQAFFDYLSLNL